MKELIPIIVDLLSKHTCVIVPDFGGFIVNEKGTVISTAGDRFFPPCKELIFNPHLSHNDGLLVHAFMQKNGISFDEANRIISGKVKSVRKEIEIHKAYSLGNFGFFSLETTGIVFHAKEISIEDVGSFGLHEFYFPVLRAEDKENAYRSTGITTSLSKTIIGGIAATIALFLFCQPLKNDMNQASLIPITVFSEAAIRNAELLARERALQKSAKTITYHLIVDEFETEESAFTFADSFELQQGDSLSILPVSEKYLITFSSSSEFEKINNRIKDFHSRYNNAFPDAFILGLE
jgi:nucleoid DNA-binding protein